MHCSRWRIASVSLLASLAAPTMFAASGQWGSKLSAPDFNHALAAIIAAAKEEQQLESLKEAPLGSTWTVRLVLPGADSCGIRREDRMVVRGQRVLPFLNYTCEAHYRSRAKALEGYKALVRMVADATSVSATPVGTDGASFAIEPHVLILVTIKDSVVVGFSATGAFKGGSSASGGLISGESLLASLRKIASAARDQPPFSSITGEKRQQPNRWQSTVALPGANECAIMVLPFTDPIPTSAPSYSCIWNYSDGMQTQFSYDRLLEEIRADGDWIESPDPSRTGPNALILKYTDFLATAPNCARLAVDVNRGNRVMVLVTPFCSSSKSSNVGGQAESSALAVPSRRDSVGNLPLPVAADAPVVGERPNVKLKPVSSPDFVLDHRLIGHGGSITSVAFSPDGRWLASGSFDKTVKIWNVSTGDEVRTLSGERIFITSIGFSPDGKWLASASGFRSIKIWEVATGREVRTWLGHDGDINTVRFSLDGQLLASAGGDKKVKVWDVATGQEARSLQGHTGGVASLAFSPDGRWLASGSGDKTVKLWDLASGQEIRTLTGHAGSVNALAFTPDGRSLASGAGQIVIFWDPTTGQKLQTWNIGHGVGSLAISPDGRSLATGTIDTRLEPYDTLILWDVTTGQMVRTLGTKNLFYVSATAFSPDGRFLASGGQDGTITLWRRAGQ